MSAPSLLVVEDDRSLAELIEWHFLQEGYNVQTLASGEEALMTARETPPDVIILDWMIEGISGLEVCRRLRKIDATANVPILMLTARSEENDRVRGLDTGADDYITKPFSPRELVARVNAVMRRVRPALVNTTLYFADIEMNVSDHRVKRGESILSLGPTEFRLLKYFMEHPKRVFSREHLLNVIWGYDSEIELRTVDVHIRRLRKAINAEGAKDVIRTVRSAGYALDEDSSDV
jgi:two-component system, OmpR family, phosphate regulon response regulator PhoB